MFWIRFDQLTGESTEGLMQSSVTTILTVGTLRLESFQHPSADPQRCRRADERRTQQARIWIHVRRIERCTDLGHLADRDHVGFEIEPLVSIHGFRSSETLNLVEPDGNTGCPGTFHQGLEERSGGDIEATFTLEWFQRQTRMLTRVAANRLFQLLNSTRSRALGIGWIEIREMLNLEIQGQPLSSAGTVTNLSHRRGTTCEAMLEREHTGRTSRLLHADLQGVFICQGPGVGEEAMGQFPFTSISRP